MLGLIYACLYLLADIDSRKSCRQGESVKISLWMLCFFFRFGASMLIGTSATTHVYNKLANNTLCFISYQNDIVGPNVSHLA